MKLTTHIHGVSSVALVYFLWGLSGMGQAQEGSFYDVRPLAPAVNSPFREVTPTVSPDGLTLVFGADANSRPGGVGSRDLWIATRGSKDEPFGDVKNLSELNTPEFEDGGSFSSDGLTLYFQSGPFGASGIFMATRGALDETVFGPPQLVPGVNDGPWAAMPAISADDLSLYYLAGDPQSFHVATRARAEEPFDNVTSIGQVGCPPDSTVIRPMPSSDGLALFFDCGFDIWMATRNNTAEPFGDAVRLFGGANPQISRDWPTNGAKMYFVSCVTTGCNDIDIYEATWQSTDVPQFLRGDTDQSGTVDSNDAIHHLKFLFLGEGTIDCQDAADSDDMGAADFSDAIFVLTWAFLGGVEISAPGPESCGLDETQDDGIDCMSYGACP